MPQLFGTDGIRGVAGVEVTTSLTRAVAAAAVGVLTDRPGRLVVLGRDPRPSGAELAAAATEGLTAAGCIVVDLGVIPTPAVAHAVAAGLPGVAERPAFGVVISASHNPASDNGIKLFGAGGTKLPVEVEAQIEAGIGGLAPGQPAAAQGYQAAEDWYVDRLLTALPQRLDGLRLVVDCANGAAASVAPRLYAGAGADVTALNVGPGERINDRCGATDLTALRAAVIEHRADLGVAHDGDADRCLAVDATGQVVDGDAILAVLALALAERSELRGDAIAATVMSNQGLVLGLAKHGIAVRRTDVGDRAVLERIEADGLSLGGEQSGHIVLADLATTGDGLLTALALAGRMAETGRSLADLASVMRRLPQVLVNVPVRDKQRALAAVAPVVAEVTARLGDDGRVLVRPSGTEPLLRVMVEATTAELASAAAERIAAAAR